MAASGGAVGRGIALGALVLAAVLIAVIVLGGSGDEQRLRLQLGNASQLVKGSEVKVAGLPIGTVSDIKLDDDNQAEVEIKVADDDLVPLHRGTRAFVRVSSLSAVANRYVAIEPGPNDAPELDDGAVIPAQDTQPAVELDAVLSTLDADTRSHIQRLAKGGATLYSTPGSAGALNQGLIALDPAVAQLEQTLRELSRDRSAFERFIVAGAGWVSAVADRQNDLQGGLASTAVTARAVADEAATLQDLLARAPGALRTSAGTLRRTASTLDAVIPAVRDARPVAPRLTTFLRNVGPVLDNLPNAVDQTRPLLRALAGYLADTPGIANLAVPAFRSARQAIAAYMPILAGTLPYVPDVILGATNGFGGTAAGPYDANGVIGRIGAVQGVFSASGLATLLNLPKLTGYEPHNFKRCPGAATQVAPDRSNDIGAAPGVPCEEGQRP